MLTRMPRFGEANVGHARRGRSRPSTAVEPVAGARRSTSPRARVKATGRFLVGGEAFGCIKCHTVQGDPGRGHPGDRHDA